MSGKKLFIPILDNGGGMVRASFMESFVLAFQGRRIAIGRYSSPYPNLNRNAATKDFLQSSYDELLMIDGDIVFDRAHIDLLLSHDVPFVAGIYPLKKKVSPPEWALELLDGSTDFPKQDAPLVEVKRTASGFMRIKREVFERLNNNPTIRSYVYECVKYADYWSISKDATGHYIGEDWYFCDRCRESGIKILCDQRIVLGHEGTAVYPL